MLAGLGKAQLGMMALACAALAIGAPGFQRDAAATQPDSGRRAREAQVAARTTHLPVIEGTDIRFTRFSPADGLSQIKVSYILQDDKGFMWFGTQYGLNRYDGYNFKVFVHELNDRNSLSGVFISALYKDRDGALWIGCGQFLDRFDPLTETFAHYPIQLVRHISQDSAGLLWLATGRGLFSLDPSSGRIRQFTHDPANPATLTSNNVKSSGEDRKGHFWVANSEGVDDFDRNTGTVRRHIPLREPLAEFSVHEDRLGNLWLFHLSGEGLSLFDRNTGTVTHYSYHGGEQPSSALSGVKSFLEDRAGNLWVGTQGSGLLQFDRQQRRFIAYRHDVADPESLAEDTVNALYEDREGNIWVALGAEGLNRFTVKSLPFKKLPYDTRHSYNKGETIVNALTADAAGALWASSREALTRIDLEKRESRTYAISDVISLTTDRQGQLWAGTFNNGLNRLDPSTGRIRNYRHDPANPGSLSNDIVARLLVDHGGTLWAATWDGLNRFDPATERFTGYKLDPQVKDVAYREISEDSSGTLWLGTESSGLHRFDPRTGQFTAFEHDGKRPGSLSDNRVNSVYFDRSGTMWVGSQNGLNRFDPTSGSFVVYTTRDGLSGNAVGCILEDGKGDLWISTNNGISRLTPTARAFKNFSTADGLPGPDMTGWGACSKARSGQMFFGGFSGGTSFFSDQMGAAAYNPPMTLTDFRLFGNSVAIGDHSPLRKSIAYTDELTLSYEQNIFSLTFAALSYANPATNRYRYKLEGLEREWTEAGSDRRSATYTTLSPGSYIFRAQGATSNGPWSEPGLTLRITIEPPWWGMWWFRGLVLAVTACALLAIYLFRIRQMARRFEIRLEERVSERTRIARELHDTLLQSFHGVLLRFQSVSNLLPEGRPKQKLDSAIEQAGEAITEGRDAVQQLRSSTVESADLATAVSALAAQLAAEAVSQPATVFEVAVEGVARDLHPVLRDEVYRIAGEALRNAFRHAQARRIEVEIRYDERQFRLRVRDDGKGMDPKVLEARGPAGHWGLHGMHERAKLLGASLNVWSQLDSGTEVELSIPAAIVYSTSVSRRRFRLFRRLEKGTRKMS